MNYRERFKVRDLWQSIQERVVSFPKGTLCQVCDAPPGDCEFHPGLCCECVIAAKIPITHRVGEFVLRV